LQDQYIGLIPFQDRKPSHATKVQSQEFSVIGGMSNTHSIAINLNMTLMHKNNPVTGYQPLQYKNFSQTSN